MTQCDLVLEYMQKYGSITDSEARRELACSRLGGRIFDLRAKGYKINKAMIEFENSKTGNKGRFARYWLAEQEPRAAGHLPEIMAELKRMAETPITEACHD